MLQVVPISLLSSYTALSPASAIATLAMANMVRVSKRSANAGWSLDVIFLPVLLQTLVVVFQGFVGLFRNLKEFDGRK